MPVQQDYLDLLPLFPEQDEETIRDRWEAWANEGLLPEDERYTDVREGSMFQICTTGGIRENARTYDLMTEVIAAALPLYAWAEFLDDHAAVQNLARLAATPATGAVRFMGTVGTVIPAGTGVGVEPVDPDAPAAEFEATVGGTIPGVLATPTGLAGAPSTGGGTLNGGTYYYVVTAIDPFGETVGSAEISSVVPAQLAAPGGVIATPTTTGGTLAAGTYYYKITARNPIGETVGSTQVSAVTTGATGKVTLSWSAVPGATEYRVYRGTTSNGQNVFYTTATASFVDTGAANTGGTVPGSNTASTVNGSVALTWNAITGVSGYRVYRGTAPGGDRFRITAAVPTAAAYTDTGTVVGAEIPPVANTTGGKLSLAIRALEAGSMGNVAAEAITVLLTPITGVSVMNPASITGGTDTETDEQLRERVLDMFIGQGAGNVNDYKRWARAYPGVGRATVVPLWNGAGTVHVIVSDVNGNPVGQPTVDGLQALLDPVPQKGAGDAPVGHMVTVSTATAVAVTVAATVECEPGYSLDGAAGTIAVRSTIDAQVRQYVESIEPGSEVVRQQVIGRVVSVLGVHDVGSVTLNGAATNVTVSADPPQLPSATINLTEGTV